MEVTILAIKHGNEDDTYDVTARIGPGEHNFRFTWKLVPDQAVGIYEISSGGFERIFRYYPHVYSTAYRLVDRFHQGQPVELPYYLGDYDVAL